MYSNKVNCTFLSQNQQPTSTTNEPFTQVKENNACRQHISNVEWAAKVLDRTCSRLVNYFG